MYAKKSLGQHFLMHARIAERMVLAASVTDKDTIVEIGPGRGLLTRVLLSQAKEVIAIETDPELIPVLHEVFAREIASKKLTVLHQDIRSFNAATIGGPYKVVANIPYYITGEIIRQFLTAANKPDSMTLLVQKEVAVRIARTKKESLLSLSVKAFGTPKYDFTVPKGAFVPAPTVDSAVLTIGSIHSPFETLAAEEKFFMLLHAGFAHKRKQLGNNFEELANTATLEKVFEEVGISSMIRAEDVTLDQWFAIANAF